MMAVLLVLLLHLVAGDGSAIYIQNTKQNPHHLSIRQILRLQLVEEDVVALNPKDREKLNFPTQDRNQPLFSPQTRDQFPVAIYLLNNRDPLLSPPLLRGKRARLWTPRWKVKTDKEDLVWRQCEYIWRIE